MRVMVVARKYSVELRRRATRMVLDARKDPESGRAVRDAELIVDIRSAHKANLGVYGARKIHAELGCKGVKVARCTVERLMRAEGLRGIPREKTRKTTVGYGAETDRPEDLVDRKFVAAAPNQLWVADLTYVRTHAGWPRRYRAGPSQRPRHAASSYSLH